MTSGDDSELLGGEVVPLPATVDSKDAALKLLAERFPNRSYCLVEEWRVFKAVVTDEELVKLHAAGHLPLFLYAHKVIEDSHGRFQFGDWVRSSMCRSFEMGAFETRNTVYVLIGPGHEQSASLKTIFSFF